mgnify:CR=1 FL=1
MLKKRIYTALCAAAVATVAAWYKAPATTHAATKTAPAAVAATSERWIAGAGRVEPASEEIKIGSELDGRLRSVAVEEGDTVRRGQVIATLDNGDYKARVQLAAATVAEREAELERLMNGSRRESRREADAVVREMQASVEHANIERTRRLALLERGAISRAEFDITDRDYAMAKARLDAARERASMTNDETRPEDVKRARAELDRARAQFDEAQAMLAKTVIRSPIDGVVLRRKLKTGESVSARAEMPVVTLGDCSRLRVRVDVDETDVAKLRVGQHAWVRADAYGDRKFAGTVISVGQILGRKNVRTDEPSERVDVKILETLILLDGGVQLPIGLRVDAYIEPRS